MKKKGFYWCAINGEAEPYCMSASCTLCPANKEGDLYDPNAQIIKDYKAGKIKSQFKSVNDHLDDLSEKLETIINEVK